MQVKSKTDVITNSSSEVFIIKSDKSPEAMKRFLEKIKEEDSRVSGMGGIVEVYDNQTTKNDCYYWDWEDYESEASDVVDEHKPFECLPDGYLAIDLDYAFQEKRRWIMTNPDYIQCLAWPGHSPKNLFWGWLKDHWEKRWQEMQDKMANLESDKDLQKIWPEYEKVERYYMSVQKCLEYEAKQT
jgi:hypothetical protein